MLSHNQDPDSEEVGKRERGGGGESQQCETRWKVLISRNDVCARVSDIKFYEACTVFARQSWRFYSQFAYAESMRVQGWNYSTDARRLSVLGKNNASRSLVVVAETFGIGLIMMLSAGHLAQEGWGEASQLDGTRISFSRFLINFTLWVECYSDRDTLNLFLQSYKISNLIIPHTELFIQGSLW